MGSNRRINKEQQEAKISLELFSITKDDIKEVLEGYKLKKELEKDCFIAFKHLKRTFEDNKKYFVLDYLACSYMEKLLEKKPKNKKENKIKKITVDKKIKK
jgi:hypothetical protein